MTSVTTSYVTAASDTFTGEATGADLRDHTADSGGTWFRHSLYAGAMQFSSAGRVYTPTGEALYVMGVPPNSSDYTVSALFRFVGAITDVAAGLIGRAVLATDTWYAARCNLEIGFDEWQLYRIVNGAPLLLAGAPVTLSQDSDYQVRLVLSGTSIRMIVNDTQVLGVNDTEIAAAGYAGLYGSPVAPQVQTNALGVHLNDFAVQDFVGVTTTSVTTTSAWSHRALPSASWVARA